VRSYRIYPNRSEMHQKLLATGLSAIAGLAFVVSRAISKGKD